jgi:ubiquinol-cytochrome c reductase cytochrome b subunit
VFFLRFLRFSPLSVVNDHLNTYPTPSNINYAWGLGSLAGLCLSIQIISGIFLAMHYTPHVDFAFSSVEHIMRDVHNGWLLRYAHSNGASVFFIVVYMHIARGVYYASYLAPRHWLWFSGVIIFLLMVITAFLGYVLPWGQMSFWGATVITNLVTAVPIAGPDIAFFLWGGFSVANPTLNRFFSLHYLLPFVIIGLVLLHLVLLHQHGSSNPLGASDAPDRTPFYPYFYVKDLFGFLGLVLVFSFLIFFVPNVLGHPDNYREADPLVTPSHIVPEWYLLPYYAILRSIPNKLLGVIAMAAAILILALLPYSHRGFLATSLFRSHYKFVFWLFVTDVILLGWIGGSSVDEPYLTIGRLATLFYFSFFVTLVPGCGILEASFLPKIGAANVMSKEQLNLV